MFEFGLLASCRVLLALSFSTHSSPASRPGRGDGVGVAVAVGRVPCQTVTARTVQRAGGARNAPNLIGVRSRHAEFRPTQLLTTQTRSIATTFLPISICTLRLRRVPEGCCPPSRSCSCCAMRPAPRRRRTMPPRPERPGSTARHVCAHQVRQSARRRALGLLGPRSASSRTTSLVRAGSSARGTMARRWRAPTPAMRRATGPATPLRLATASATRPAAPRPASRTEVTAVRATRIRAPAAPPSATSGAPQLHSAPSTPRQSLRGTVTVSFAPRTRGSTPATPSTTPCRTRCTSRTSGSLISSAWSPSGPRA